MAISLLEHRNAITKKSIATIDEIKPIRSGFSGFFPVETTPTREVSLEVRRGSRLIAADVQMFSDGNGNKVTKFSEKIYIPPYFKEWYNFSSSSVYDLTFGSGINPNQASARLMLADVRKNMAELKNKIGRAILKQQAQVLQTGIVTLENGDDIDFKRKAASKPDLGSSNYWNEAGGKPLDNLQTGMEFIRNEGNSSATEANVIMSSAGFSAFKSNTQVKEQAEWTNINRVDIKNPVFDNATGLVFQGQISTNDFIMNIWTYNEVYQNTVGGTNVRYLDSNKVVILPDDFMGKTIHGAVPALDKNGEFPYAKEAEYYSYSVVDREAMASKLFITSAPLVVPFDLDKIYSPQVLA